MEYIKQPSLEPGVATAEVRDTVSEIIRAVERRGTEAVREYSERFDRWSPDSFRVGEETIAAAQDLVAEELHRSLGFLIDQVVAFARLQRSTLQDFERETLPGVVLGQKFIPVDAVGAYSPGGIYPLMASPVMTIATAKVAQVGRVVGMAPPRDGRGMHPPQLWAMHASGADEVFCVGGVQGLAGLAFGLEDAEPVDMIAGPGNAYVSEAKRQLYGTVGVDLLAGPTEILVLADDTADPVVVACDLLGQAEHGPTSPAILVTTSKELAHRTIVAVDKWLESWPTANIAGAAWRDYGAVIVCADMQEACQLCDELAAEHVEVQVCNPHEVASRLRNYGSVFIGDHATVAYSDKAIGTNHTLPTKRAARYTGGLWVGKFLKTVTTQWCSYEGSLAVAPHAAVIADAELMAGHAISARLRLDDQYFPEPAGVGRE